MKNKKNVISATELKSLLNSGPVEFSFEKRDGSVRKARGTRSVNLIPRESAPKGGDSSPKVVAFYDLDRADWRSVSALAEIELA